MMNGKLNKTEGFAILISENISVHSLYEIRLGLIENFGMTRHSISEGSGAGRSCSMAGMQIPHLSSLMPLFRGSE